MKLAVGFVCYGLFALALHGQVRCTLAVEPKTWPLKSGDKLTANLSVTISPGWHISSITQPEGGPVRTEISLASKQGLKLVGVIVGPEPHKEHSAAFDMDVETYTGTVVFTLPLVATEDVPFDKLRARPLVVEITYQACNEETCLLPKTERVSCVIGEGKPATSDTPPANKKP